MNTIHGKHLGNARKFVKGNQTKLTVKTTTSRQIENGKNDQL